MLLMMIAIEIMIPPMMIIMQIFSSPGCRSSKQSSIVSFQRGRRTPAEMTMIIIGDDYDDKNHDNDDFERGRRTPAEVMIIIGDDDDDDDKK